jgi:hypothetical protein
VGDVGDRLAFGGEELGDALGQCVECVADFLQLWWAGWVDPGAEVPRPEPAGDAGQVAY